MMSLFASVANGVVVEVIPAIVKMDGRDVSVAERYHVDFVATLVACPDNTEPGWSYNGTDFVAVDLGALKAAKITALSAACGGAIVGGYKSSALGAEHLYPSLITDQINMMGSVTASLLPDAAPDWSTQFWCRDLSGEWAFRSHTAAQIQQAGADGKAHILSCQASLAELSAQVSAATTPEDVEATRWE